MSFVRNCLCLNPFINFQFRGFEWATWTTPGSTPDTVQQSCPILPHCCGQLLVQLTVQIIIIVSVQYTELLRTVPLIIASGHSLESVNNVHVFLLTFHLCSLFQQWMHQDFASQSKCNALVTSSTFRCAFKELFF